jgi:hypothetical protein
MRKKVLDKAVHERECARREAQEAQDKQAMQQAKEAREERAKAQAAQAAGDESSSDDSDEEQIEAQLKMLYKHAGSDLRQARLAGQAQQEGQELTQAEEVVDDDDEEEEEYVPEELRLIHAMSVDEGYQV